MTFLEELTDIVDKIVKTSWEVTDGRTVPSTEEIGLGNKGVRLDATFLYSDLADSTELAMHSQELAAETYKAFLACCTKIILLRGGHVRSFDGDRVMGVFVGTAKNTSAVKAALQINYVFLKALVPTFETQYQAVRDGTVKLAHCTGVDTSSVLVARAGVRNNNDLIWVGQAPNIAAKLSTIRDKPYFSCITKKVYDSMDDSVKLSNGTNMWESRTWSVLPTGLESVYRSSWHWQP